MPWQPHPKSLPQHLKGWPLKQALTRYSAEHHGDFNKWAQALSELPEIVAPSTTYGDTVTVTGTVDTQKLEQTLRQFHPWRKGPFSIGGVKIDTEWRSDWKWQRIASCLGDLSGQRVLDIGCGNGYFGWRMLAQGAEEVVGIDPTLLFCMQHLAMQHYIQDPRNWVLPLKIEEIPATTQFDTVLSMGVIYHRRDPLEHTSQLASLIKPGGLVLLESLVVNAQTPLIPENRYARMRNVWCVPDIDTMHSWLASAEFTNITTVDVSPTTLDEQRSTQWMHFESLAQALDPEDPSKTVEGYPAPVRAVVTARKPPVAR